MKAFPWHRGCTPEQIAYFNALRRTMKARGVPKHKTPIVAFDAQRGLAARRGIGWELTLPEWWAIWQKSGHWHERGRGHGYVMCRSGDIGPYAKGNVFIATNAFNVSTGPHKKRDLPMGVTRITPTCFQARRWMDRKSVNLGCFKTPAEASAAYLRSFPEKQQAAA